LRTNFTPSAANTTNHSVRGIGSNFVDLKAAILKIVLINNCLKKRILAHIPLNTHKKQDISAHFQKFSGDYP